MKFFIALLVLIVTSFSHANEQMAEATKAISIQGITVLMGLEQAKSILVENGYQELSFNPESGQAFFKKENCIVSFVRAGSGQTIMYRCTDRSRDVGILQTLNTLCKIKASDQYIRKGCDPKNTVLGKQVSESFTHSEAYKGYIYSANIKLSEKGASQISVAAVETKEPTKVKNNKEIYVKKVTGQVAHLMTGVQPIKLSVNENVFFRVSFLSGSDGPAAKCRGVYFLDETVKSFLGGEPYDRESAKQLEKYVRNIAYDYPYGTWVELSDIRIVEEGIRTMCLFGEITAIPAPKN